MTFDHHSNFFLYTGLESARPILSGRGGTTQSQAPVLTGTPVTGQAYLDRPLPAGYFIFPDLSVRHEGKYRLTFALFEDPKGETADTQPEYPVTTPASNRLPHTHPITTRETKCVHFRLEVKSEPFTVYSAKRFPGLAESTNLSRVVAEQGCRVRIRRDVRMRRREPKATKDGNLEEDTTYSRPDRYGTPEIYDRRGPVERDRSASATSVDPNNTAFPLPERRSSIHEGSGYPQQNYQSALVGPILQPASAGYTHLTFGGTSSGLQGQAPALPTSVSVPAQACMPFSPSSSTYQPQRTLSHSRHISSGSDFACHQQAYASLPGGAQGGNEVTEQNPATVYRGQPVPQGPSTARESAPFPAVDSRVAVGAQTYYAHPPVGVDPRSSTPAGLQPLPPLKTLQHAPEGKYEPAPTPTFPGDAAMVGPPSAYDAAYGFSNFAPSGHNATTGLSRPGKRSYGKVFDTSHLNQPVHGGARPEISGQETPQVACDEGLVDENELNDRILFYRRADGTRQQKKIPSPGR